MSKCQGTYDGDHCGNNIWGSVRSPSRHPNSQCHQHAVSNQQQALLLPWSQQTWGLWRECHERVVKAFHRGTKYKLPVIQMNLTPPGSSSIWFLFFCAADPGQRVWLAFGRQGFQLAQVVGSKLLPHQPLPLRWGDPADVWPTRHRGDRRVPRSRHQRHVGITTTCLMTLALQNKEILSAPKAEPLLPFKVEIGSRRETTNKSLACCWHRMCQPSAEFHSYGC